MCTFILFELSPIDSWSNLPSLPIDRLMEKWWKHANYVCTIYIYVYICKIVEYYIEFMPPYLFVEDSRFHFFHLDFPVFKRIKMQLGLKMTITLVKKLYSTELRGFQHQFSNLYLLWAQYIGMIGNKYAPH